MKSYGNGIGGSTIAEELAAITPTAHLAVPIQKEEFQARLDKAYSLMREQGIRVIYLHAGPNLYYFTGTRWHSSDRMVGALLFVDGTLEYLAPEFEEGTILEFMGISGPVNCWQEHEGPYALFHSILSRHDITEGSISVDEVTPFFNIDGITKANPLVTLKNAKPISAGCRMIKSAAEIAIMQLLMNITLDVQKATARILRTGISAKEVTDFIHQAHIHHGVPSGSYFCIVLFGVDSSFPHGVRSPKVLEEGEIVLVDTGCQMHDYISDITRTYVYGEPSDEQRRIWNIEQETQQAAFDAARLGASCSEVDAASRRVIESHGLGPGYKLPGLPHRTGHGIGLEIHEWPYIVRNDDTILEPGMCFSVEPMICVPNAFGIRHEDHVHMTVDGPRWFTKPMHSIEDPFGVNAG